MADFSLKPSLRPGEVIITDKGEKYLVKAFLGRGGQGEVYRVSGPAGNLALKWYHRERFLNKINAEAFYRNIKRNVDSGIPQLTAGDTATQFLWPMKFVPWQKGSFGYLMRLFPEGYESFSGVLLGRRKNQDGTVTPLVWRSWHTMITAALNIVRAFEILHSRGLSYQDLNEGGLAMNLSTGDVLICDCDNVSPDKTNMGILGIVHYMAPEVVCGQLPDRQSDEYSLAVLLFRLFYRGHPMMGRESVELYNKLNRAQADYRIFGTDPHYCLDMDHPVNRPHPVFHQDVLRLFGVFPQVLLEAFHTVFTSGIKDKGVRLTSTQWRKALLQVRDYLATVENKERFFFTPQNLPVPDEARLLVCPGGQKVLAMPGKLMYACHIDPYSRDFTTPIAKVIPTDRPGVIGLYNGTSHTFQVDVKGKTIPCPPKERMPLLKGMTIRVGTAEIHVS